MSEQKNNIRSKIWGCWNDQKRLPLEDFLELIRENIITIATARENLQRAHSLFKEQEKILQDQYSYLIGLAYAMDSPVQDLSRFLDQRTLLPVAILPLRHQFTTKLLTIKELLWTVLALAGSLRSIHKTDPQEIAMTRHKMQQKLDILLKESENIAQFTQIISDQALFQEYRDTTWLLREIPPRNDNQTKGDNWNVYDISLYRRNERSLFEERDFRNLPEVNR